MADKALGTYEPANRLPRRAYGIYSDHSAPRDYAIGDTLNSKGMADQEQHKPNKGSAELRAEGLVMREEM